MILDLPATKTHGRVLFLVEDLPSGHRLMKPGEAPQRGRDMKHWLPGTGGPQQWIRSNWTEDPLTSNPQSGQLWATPITKYLVESTNEPQPELHV